MFDKIKWSWWWKLAFQTTAYHDWISNSDNLKSDSFKVMKRYESTREFLVYHKPNSYMEVDIWLLTLLQNCTKVFNNLFWKVFKVEKYLLGIYLLGKFIQLSCHF